MVSPRKLPAILLVDLLLFVLAGLGVYQTHYTNALPVHLRATSGNLISTETFGNIPKGATLEAIDVTPIHGRDDLEFNLNFRQPEERVVSRWILPDGSSTTATLTTVPAYGWGYLAVQVFVILSFFGFGLLLRLKRSGDLAARTAHWLAFAAGSIVALTWGSDVVLPQSLDLLIRELYLVASIATGALYVHFALVFPRVQARKRFLRVLYAIAAALLSWSVVTAAEAYTTRSLDAFHAHLAALRSDQIFFSLSAILASVLFARSYRLTVNSGERLKIKWALAGSAFSVLSYVFLWLLPQLVGSSPLVPEEVILLTSVFAPITITIAIIRHRLFDIDAVLSRATTYTLAIIGLVAVYIALALVLGSVLEGRLSLPLGAALAGAVALLFEPLKRRLQKWVDFRFFRVRYNFREAERYLREELKEADDRESIEAVLRRVFTDLLHPESIALVPAPPTLRSIEGDPRYVEQGVELQALTPAGSTVVQVPIAALERPMAIQLGPKRSGDRYSQEDLDLIASAAMLASLRLERLALREKLAEERLTAEREKELNRLRALVLSSVTHDLKTPLTSIHMFAELLEDSARDATEAEYLKIIEGEAERLTSLIDNVLDYSRIERGAMEYSLEPVSLQQIVKDSVRPLQHLVKLQNAALDVACGDEDIVISGDRHALERAIANLISNALKYSSDDKRICVELKSEDHRARISVQDHGIGIPAEDMDRIFQAYYRSHANTGHAPGIGLGLATVQHVVEAHAGKIDVQSSVGQGTTITLTFPLLHA
jgi:signal transduction histidine kinase